MTAEYSRDANQEILARESAKKWANADSKPRRKVTHRKTRGETPVSGS